MPAAPEAWKRPESSLPESLQRAWLCQNLEFELPELGDNKCLSFKLHSETANCSVISHSLGMHGLYSPWNSPCQNAGVGSDYLLQGIFATQGLDPDLPHCRWILYQLSYEGSPTCSICVPNCSAGKESACQRRRHRRCGFDP